MGKTENPGESFLSWAHISILPNREEKLERKVLSQHFYTNTLFLSPLTATNTMATNTTIFLSNISKLKHNQIIRIQTQKRNFKINQIIAIKEKKKKKTKDRSHLTHLDCVVDEDEWRLQARPIALGRRWPIWTALGTNVLESSKKKKKKIESKSWRKKKKEKN